MVKIFRENEAIAEATEEAKEQHYEVPTEFFKFTLGRWLKYSSCYWPKSCQSLDQSEVEMLELICDRAQMEDGLEVLDLGCGWGSCGLYLLNKYPNIKVTFFSNSKTQQVNPLIAKMTNHFELSLIYFSRNTFGEKQQKAEIVQGSEVLQVM